MALQASCWYAYTSKLNHTWIYTWIKQLLLHNYRYIIIVFYNKFCSISFSTYYDEKKKRKKNITVPFWSYVYKKQIITSVKCCVIKFCRPNVCVSPKIRRKNKTCITTHSTQLNMHKGKHSYSDYNCHKICITSTYLWYLNRIISQLVNLIK